MNEQIVREINVREKEEENGKKKKKGKN